MKKIAVLGCGTVSQTFCVNAPRHLKSDYFINAVCAKNFEHAEELSARVGGRAAHTVEEMLELSPDVVVEFAGIEAVETYAEDILKGGADLVISSVGALDDAAFRDKIVHVARQYERHIYVISGAIGGLDLMKTYGVIGDAEVEIESIRPPASFEGVPFMQGKTLSSTDQEVVFEGNVHEAIKAFPRNVNVTVATALATRSEKAKVRLISDPNAKFVSHKIHLANKIMESELLFKSIPYPDNPKNSLSAAYSVIALLKNLASPLNFF